MRPVQKFRQAVVFLLVCIPFSASAAPQTPEDRLKEIEIYCLQGDKSMADYRSCLADREAREDRELGRAVRKRHFDISEIAKNTDGPLFGKEDARKYKAAFDAEQSLFVAFRKKKCENVAQFENAGGSNAGGAASKCFLRLTLQRIYDLNIGY